MAVASQGIQISVGATPTAVGEVVSFDGPTASKPEIETTHLQSTAQEFLPGLPDYGSITMTMNFTDPEDAGQTELRTNFEAAGAAAIAVQIDFPGGSGSARLSGTGYVSEYPLAAETNGKVDQNATLRITGAMTRTTQP